MRNAMGCESLRCQRAGTGFVASVAAGSDLIAQPVGLFRSLPSARLRSLPLDFVTLSTRGFLVAFCLLA